MAEGSRKLSEFAGRYTAAWCSGNPGAVAAFFSPDATFQVNDGEPVAGRAAIAEIARGFMKELPDMEVRMDGLLERNGRVFYQWTLTGRTSGPGGAGGTGQAVNIRGFEEWKIGGDGLIAQSRGYFDAEAYAKQLQDGATTPRFVAEDEVRARLSMPALIEAMERALVEFSGGRVMQPVRSVIVPGGEKPIFGLMPSHVSSLPAMGAKLVTVCPANARRGIDTHQALIVMFDPVTGVPEAILDGRYITEARTAAVSAVSARHLARKDARVLGILGSGVQARSHFEALRLVRKFSEVRVWSPNADRRQRFASETGARAMESAEAVVRGADVVVAVTGSATPVVMNDWVGEGTHVIGVGACLPTQRELDPALVARARLIVDSRAAALKEAGDVVMGIAESRWTAEHIAAELGELPKRRDEREVTVFKSLGLAVEDVFSAHLALRGPGR